MQTVKEWEKILKDNLYVLIDDTDGIRRYRSGYIYVTLFLTSVLFEIGFNNEFREVRIVNQEDLRKLELFLE